MYVKDFMHTIVTTVTPDPLVSMVTDMDCVRAFLHTARGA